MGNSVGTYSDKLPQVLQSVTNNGTLREELSKIKQLAEESLGQLVFENGDKYRLVVRESSLKIDDDGETTFIVTIEGIRDRDRLMSLLEDHVKAYIQEKWKWEVFVRYERGY